MSDAQDHEAVDSSSESTSDSSQQRWELLKACRIIQANGLTAVKREALATLTAQLSSVTEQRDRYERLEAAAKEWKRLWRVPLSGPALSSHYRDEANRASDELSDAVAALAAVQVRSPDMTQLHTDIPAEPRYCPWCGSEVAVHGHDDDCATRDPQSSESKSDSSQTMKGTP